MICPHCSQSGSDESCYVSGSHDGKKVSTFICANCSYAYRKVQGAKTFLERLPGKTYQQVPIKRWD